MNNCCEKCKRVMEGADILQSERFVCANPSCKCHSTPSPIGWEDDLAFNWEKRTRDEGTLKSFISQTLSQEEARIRANEADKCEEHTKRAVVEEREKVVKMGKSIIKDWNGAAEGTEALSELLTRIQEGK